MSELLKQQRKLVKRLNKVVKDVTGEPNKVSLCMSIYPTFVTVTVAVWKDSALLYSIHRTNEQHSNAVVRNFETELRKQFHATQVDEQPY